MLQRHIRQILAFSICLAVSVDACLLNWQSAVGQDVSKDADAKEAVEADDSDKDAPLVKYVTVVSPVNEVVAARVINAAIELQHQAEKQDRSATLVLEIEGGTSKFGQTLDLAKEIASARFARVRTVAWIPKRPDDKPVDGYQVLLALACNEIVMHPDAEIGDIGRGKALDVEEQHAVIALVDKRRNPKVTRALVLGMMDPAQTVLKAKLERKAGADATSEGRVVTPEELDRLRDNFQGNIDVETIWERGETGLLAGSRARALDVLVVQTATSRGEIADLYGFPPEDLREQFASGDVPRARLIRVDEMIEPILEGFVDREVRRAVASGADLIIFEIDSPGGFLVSSTNLAYMIADLEEKKVRTVAYIPRLALSGAAIIAFGCDEIYLQPNAQIGDAGPIEMREGGQFQHAPEKVLSHLRETLKTLAERKGRPPALLEAMADKDLRVFEVTHAETGRVSYMTEDEIHNSNDEWVKGALVPESREDNLLTLSGKRAHELGLAQSPVSDWDDLKPRLGIPDDVKLAAVGRTWVDTLIFVLNSRPAMFLMFVAGAACIYFELHTTTGFFGILAALCFSLFFWSRFLGGTAGWLEVVLFVLGLALIAIEIFLIPGFGVFGVSGGLAVLVALILASQTFIIPHTPAQIEEMTWTLGTLSASVVSVIVMAVVMSRYLPEVPFLNCMILAPPGGGDELDPDAPRLDPHVISANSVWLPGEANRETLLGNRGQAVSMLRPAGKAQFGDRFVDVVSDGPFIDAGTQIEVIEVVGNRVVVRQVV